MYQTESAKPPFIGDLGWPEVGGRMFEAIEIPVHGGPGGAGLVAFVIALAVCVLVGRFVWRSFNEPVSTAQRVIAGALVVFFFGGIIVMVATH
jgi:hypothetical protein